MWQPVFMPQTDDPVEGTDPDVCVRGWLDDLRDAGLEVCGVLGYCAGAALALRAAELVKESGQGDPALILFDPARVDSEVIQELFVTSAEGYAELLPPERIEAAVSAAASITDSLGEDIGRRPAGTLTDAMRELQHVYDGVVRDACAALGADEEVGKGFSERFAAFLSYLITAGRAGAYPADSGKPMIVVSQNHVPEGFGVASHRVPVPRAELLADPATARLVAEVVR
ncbi:hypothetical protein [Micromonospora eburnea]|uniref:hypothetical protein n=1 Tax=Micromonospora eburnea TaxID=227316 RepID=UPI00114CB29B|nr:hypothetical protein [Micromonospora eburnea]